MVLCHLGGGVPVDDAWTGDRSAGPSLQLALMNAVTVWSDRWDPRILDSATQYPPSVSRAFVSCRPSTVPHSGTASGRRRGRRLLRRRSSHGDRLPYSTQHRRWVLLVPERAHQRRGHHWARVLVDAPPVPPRHSPSWRKRCFRPLRNPRSGPAPDRFPPAITSTRTGDRRATVLTGPDRL
jgi:hypothetical protein